MNAIDYVLAGAALCVFTTFLVARFFHHAKREQSELVQSFGEWTKAHQTRGRPQPVAVWQPPERGVVIARTPR